MAPCIVLTKSRLHALAQGTTLYSIVGREVKKSDSASLDLSLIGTSSSTLAGIEDDTALDLKASQAKKLTN